MHYAYLEKFGSPAELPAEMNGLKSQQFRWMKGGAENARKLLPTIWKSNLRFMEKVHGTIHLMSTGIFLFIFLGGVFSVPMVFALQQLGFNANIFALFWSGLIAVILIYFVANVQAEINTNESVLRRTIKFIFLFPVFLSLSMGLGLHNSIAVLQGYMGKKSAFIRTPKFNINTITDTFQKTKYRTSKISWTTIFEGILTLYFLFGIVAGLYTQNFAFIAFHTLLMFGYGTIFFFTVKHLQLK